MARRLRLACAVQPIHDADSGKRPQRRVPGLLARGQVVNQKAGAKRGVIPDHILKRWRAKKTHWHLGVGVRQFKFGGMQQQATGFCHDLFRCVQSVPKNRMADRL